MAQHYRVVQYAPRVDDRAAVSLLNFLEGLNNGIGVGGRSDLVGRGDDDEGKTIDER